MDNDKLMEVNPYFESVAKEKGFYSTKLMDAIAQKGSIRDFEEIPERVYFVFKIDNLVISNPKVSLYSEVDPLVQCLKVW